MDEKVDAIAVRGDLRHVLSLLVAPTLITQLTMTVGWLGETYFVKQLGDEAIAAIGSAGQVSWLLMVLSMMVSAGATTLIAQSWGAGDLRSAQRVVTATLQQGLLFGLLAMSLGSSKTRFGIGLESRRKSEP
jgi:Na+-driven multidrug efflux pump